MYQSEQGRKTNMSIITAWADDADSISERETFRWLLRTGRVMAKDVAEAAAAETDAGIKASLEALASKLY